MPAGKRKTILAAMTLFAQQGFHGTSTMQVAEVAKVSQATVFKYFKTKEDLLLGYYNLWQNCLVPLYKHYDTV